MTIAILAHDSRKELALQFCTAYSGILSRNTVIATGTTGRMLTQATGLPVHCYLSGKLGGIQQISTRATSTTVRASTPTSWSRCPSIGPCAEPVFKTFSPFVVLCIEGFRQRKTPQKLSHFCGVFLSYALRYH